MRSRKKIVLGLVLTAAIAGGLRHEAAIGREWRACADPLGNELRVQQRADALVLWSRGRDGVDDGGAGTFTKGADRVLRLEPTRAPR